MDIPLLDTTELNKSIKLLDAVRPAPQILRVKYADSVERKKEYILNKIHDGEAVRIGSITYDFEWILNDLLDEQDLASIVMRESYEKLSKVNDIIDEWAESVAPHLRLHPDD